MITTVQTASAKTALSIDGDSSLPWIVLSGSLGSNFSMWNSQIGVLTKYRRVLRYDPPGHGRSGHPTRPLTLHNMGDDVIQLMDAYGIGQADFLGLSMGGMIGLGLSLDHPSRIRSTICACARGRFSPAILKEWDARITAAGQGGMAAVLEGTLSRWFTPTASPSVRSAAAEMILGTSVEGYIACIHAIKNLDFECRLKTCQVPVHFMAGEFDAGAPMADIAAMAESTPKGSISVVPGAAHLANMEASEAFNKIVAKYLSPAAQ